MLHKCSRKTLPNPFTYRRITQRQGPNAIPHGVWTSQTPCGMAVGLSANDRGAGLPWQWAQDPTVVCTAVGPKRYMARRLDTAAASTLYKAAEAAATTLTSSHISSPMASGALRI
jgi:hypothetical protein